MNVKPGDLAVIVGGRYPENRHALVRVIRPYVDGETLPGHGGPYGSPSEFGWVIESLGRPLVVARWPRETSMLHAARDSSLRPLRDPGDDAKDETLLWLPVPTKETA